MSGEEMTVGSLTGLLEGGVVSVQLAQDAATGERLLTLAVEMEGGRAAEVTLHADEVVEVATDLLMFAQHCRQHTQGGPQ